MKQQERREQAWTTNFLIEGMTHQPQDHCVVSTTESSDGNEILLTKHRSGYRNTLNPSR